MDNLTLYTTRCGKAYRQRCEALGIVYLDITVKSADAYGQPFAPTWEMVQGFKSGVITWERYTELYTEMMRQSYITRRPFWDGLLQSGAVALACYCPVGASCHRYLLADLLVKAGAAGGVEVARGGELELVRQIELFGGE